MADSHNNQTEPCLCRNCGTRPVLTRCVTHAIGEGVSFERHLCEECTQAVNPGMDDVVEKLSTGKCEMCDADAMILDGIPPNEHLYCFACVETAYNER